MRILIVNQRFWPAATGSERWLLAMAQRFAADGHDVSVATTDGLEADFAANPRARRATPEREQVDGISIRRFALAHLPGSPLTFALWRYWLFPSLAALRLPPTWLAVLARWAPGAPKLFNWLDHTSERFDLVLAANVLADGLAYAAGRLARRCGARFVLTPFTHLGAGAVPGSDDVGRHYTLRHQRALVVSADRVLAMTATEQRFYLSAGASAEAVHVVGAGIDIESIRPGDAARFRARAGLSGPIVVFLAPLHRDKGFPQVVEAVERCRRAGVAVTLVAVGPEYPTSRARLRALQAEQPDAVRVIPTLTETEKRDLLAAADLLAMPSRTDSFGIVFLEAWAQGKPVLGSTAWGMGDVITEGVDGLQVPFGDAAATTIALQRLLTDATLQQRLGAAGRARTLAEHTWDQVYARVCAACEVQGR
ncbi:MAG: glycosyltransferase family 4 protein [Anaerolineales bacterium]|nr:glycosyltransferase family 4 protein [Anaerolineales bacterium]